MVLKNLSLTAKIILGSCGTLILLATLGVISYNSIGSLLASNQWVDHTHEVIQKAMKIEAAAVDMETGMRGYLLAGKEGFLGPYKNGKEQFRGLVADLKKTVDNNPDLVQLIGEIEQTINDWENNIVAPMIALRRKIGDAETMNDMARLVGQAKGKVYFDKFRDQIETFLEKESKQIALRQNAAQVAMANNETKSKQIADTNALVEQAHKVISMANQILAAAVEMQTGMRGYLLAGKEEFLNPYKDGQKRLDELIASLSKLVHENPSQVKWLGEIKASVDGWQKNVTEPAIALRRKVGAGKTMDDVLLFVGKAEGKAYFDKLRGQIATFREKESRYVAFSQEAAKESMEMAADSRKTAAKMAALIEHNQEVFAAANEIIAAAVDMETGLRGYLLAGKEEFLNPYKSGQKRFNDLVASLSKAVNDYPNKVKLLEEIKTTIDEWQENVTEAQIELRRKIGDAKTMDDMADLVGEAKGKVYFEKFRNQIKTFMDKQEVIMAQRQQDARKTASDSTAMIIGGILFATLIALVISFFLAKSVTRPFKEIFKGLKTFSKRELGDVEKQFKEVINGLTSGAVSVSQASMEMAEGSSQQAASIEETSSSLEEMSSMTRSNAENANQANTLMTKTNQVVGQASGSMDELTTSMEEISKASEETQKIIKTIDEIAFQTNLLALNAAVEAARAGEAGAGFAVVADEVRNLALRAADAAKNTSDMIENTVNRVKGGSGLVAKTNDAFSQVTENVAKVGELVGEISAASNEQAQGIEEVNKAVSEMDKVVQANAASTEEMSSQSEELNSLVSVLLAIIEGSSGNGSDQKLAAAEEFDTETPMAPATATRTNGKDLTVHQTKEVSDEDFMDF